jgi:hypothetical protein
MIAKNEKVSSLPFKLLNQSELLYYVELKGILKCLVELAARMLFGGTTRSATMRTTLENIGSVIQRHNAINLSSWRFCCMTSSTLGAVLLRPHGERARPALEGVNDASWY